MSAIRLQFRFEILANYYLKYYELFDGVAHLSDVAFVYLVKNYGIEIYEPPAIVRIKDHLDGCNFCKERFVTATNNFFKKK